jgi:hypothetical protein
MSEELSFTIDLHDKDFILYTGVSARRMEDEVVERITKCKGEYLPNKKGFLIPKDELCNLIDECFDYFTQESLLSISTLLENNGADHATKERVREKSVSKNKARAKPQKEDSKEDRPKEDRVKPQKEDSKEDRVKPQKEDVKEDRVKPQKEESKEDRVKEDPRERQRDERQRDERQERHRVDFRLADSRLGDPRLADARLGGARVVDARRRNEELEERYKELERQRLRIEPRSGIRMKKVEFDPRQDERHERQRDERLRDERDEEGVRGELMDMMSDLRYRMDRLEKFIAKRL